MIKDINNTFEGGRYRDMKNNVMEFTGQQIGRFFVPAFVISPGEIVIIKLAGGPHYMETVKLFLQLKTAGQPEFHFVKLKNRIPLFTTTVQSYLKKNGNPQNPLINSIYTVPGITPDTKVRSLHAVERKILALCSAISVHNNIVADFQGVPADKAEIYYSIIQQHAGKNGAALLFDWTAEFKDRCSRYVEATIPVTPYPATP